MPPLPSSPPPSRPCRECRTPRPPRAPAPILPAAMTAPDRDPAGKSDRDPPPPPPFHPRPPLPSSSPPPFHPRPRTPHAFHPRWPALHPRAACHCPNSTAPRSARRRGLRHVPVTLTPHLFSLSHLSLPRRPAPHPAVGGIGGAAPRSTAPRPAPLAAAACDTSPSPSPRKKPPSPLVAVVASVDVDIRVLLHRPSSGGGGDRGGRRGWGHRRPGHANREAGGRGRSLPPERTRMWSTTWAKSINVYLCFTGKFNICRKGLNPLMFTFALLGNLTYVGSILVNSLDWSKVGPNLPWLVDAGRCVLLDSFIVLQLLYFHYRKQLEFSDEHDNADKA